MDMFLEVKKKLDELDIPFELVEHEPVVTTELADNSWRDRRSPDKNNVSDKQKKTEFYLLIMDDSKKTGYAQV